MPRKKPVTVLPFVTRLPAYSPAWVAALREHRALSQVQAAKLCGVSQAAWSQWESGKKQPDGCCRKLLDLVAKAVI